MLSRKDDLRQGGRRPLAMSGQNRQMLHNLHESLSHLHVKEGPQKGGENGEGTQGLKPELSQSTPNLIEVKSTREGYNKKALATIRSKLRPFQTDRNEDNNANNTNASSSSQGSEDAALHPEDISQVRYSLSKPVKRKPSFEAKYGQSPSTDNTSDRSDSPLTQPNRVLPFTTMNDTSSSFTMSSATSRQITPSPTVNGDQTPPPVPPRIPMNTRSQTPTQDVQPAIFENIQGIMQQLPVQLQNMDQCPPSVIVPVSQTIQQVPNRDPPKYIAYSKHNIQHASQPQPQSQSPNSGPVTPQRGMSPVGRQPGIPQSASSYPVAQHYNALTNQNGPISSAKVTTGSGSNITIKYSHPPPPYSQSPNAWGGNPAQIHIHGANNTDPSHIILPDPFRLDSSSVSSAGSDTSSGLSNKQNIAHPMQSWNAMQPPIVMQSVKSREVKKPVLQTATAPSMQVSPASMQPSLQNPAGMSPSPQNQNYISSYQAQINQPNVAGHPTTSQNVRDLQIQITRHASGQTQLTPEQIAHLHSQNRGRHNIQIHIQHQQNGGKLAQLGTHYAHNVQMQNQYPDFFQRSTSDTPISTPRSESPANSRATNQSPMSILSTNSTPSTNSDIPDKPPPPYPGRSVNVVQPIPKPPHQHQQLHQVNFHPPPHYPPSTVQGFIPVQVPRTSSCTYQSESPQPPLPPRVPLQGQSAKLVTVTEVSDTPPVLPPKNTTSQQPPPIPPPPTTKTSGNNPPPPSIPSQQINGANKQCEQGEETDDTMSQVSDTSSTQEKTRCTSPIPERKKDIEMERLRRDSRLRNYSPQAFKFYMEQHVETLLKSHKERQRRRMQLEREMSKVGLSEEAQHQMRRMLEQKESNYIRLKRAKMDKCMFERIKTLGVGAFGEVTLVRKRDVGHLYAMKTLRKSDVLKRNQVAHVKAERDILAEADNEWVVKLYYSFQDRDYLYFVMDYVPGGDLMNLLIKFGIFKENLARFYIAELVLAIESVHKMGFIHRDIKPDNILIDKDGHIKLTDFGLCTGFRWTHNSKYYQKDGLHPRQDSMDVSCAVEIECQCDKISKPLERRRQRQRHRCLAHSLVGTPNYIAPEVLKRQGYTSCCDWWSVGVILYEMLVGQPPFYAATPAETQFKVIHWDETLHFPPEPKLCKEASNMILSLCCGVNERLGRNGATEIKKHPFFAGLNFEGLRKSKAPYKPTISHATDTSNFDDYDPKIRSDDEDDETQKPDHPVNGKHPEHAFFEFTFRRFFDDGGHPYPSMKDEPKDADVPPQKDSIAPVFV
ncbi:hypothetical protein FSP39_020302 [Pinctada imbricata]|uniref:non-specific serine/threonine protein kinase n=1 Tax=Pinctada imbricata TaxID=66713 RepID=A0AA88YFZ9_PINIB|nr:hypothetical protein FSP39_020302 [Pinctada imbricata]